MNVNVALLKIPVRDLAVSVPFYEVVLGAEPSFVSDEYGWAHYAGSPLDIALYVPGKGGGNRTPGGSVDFHLHHHDVAALREIVLAVASDAEVFTNADGTQSLEFADPDGNVIKIMGG